jgi:hypothetical protein
MPFGGLLTVGLIGAGTSLFSGIFGANKAKQAADQQVAEQERALQFQKDVYGDTKANQQPFVQAGQSSIAQLMDAIKAGKYGPGSIATPAAFKAPTLEEARNSPGYQFTQEQGEQGIERGAAAAGGAFTGGTLKALAGFNTNLADSTYGDVFNRALTGYNASLADYQARLQGQAQSFNQLTSIAGLGENAAANAGNNGAQAAATIGNTLGNIGNAQAAGTVGAANALTGALQGVSSSATTPLYLYYLQQQQQQRQQSSQLPPGQTYNVPYQPPTPTPAWNPLYDEGGG